jgi:hypothetical protein
VARKKSGRLAAQKFKQALDRIEKFTHEVETANLSDQAVSWAYAASPSKITGIVRAALVLTHFEHRYIT